MPTSRLNALHHALGLRDYNYRHFRTKHIVADACGTIGKHGIQPAEEAPDFTLHIIGGGTTSLSQLRGEPVLLRFGSAT